MMNYDEFKTSVVKSIAKFLPTGYIAVLTSCKKVNKMVDGLCIRKEDSSIGANIRLEEVYEAYQEEQDLQDVLGRYISSAVNSLEENAMELMQNFKVSIEHLDDHIYYQLVNAEWNAHLMENCPHRRYQDLLIVYRILVEEESEGYGSALIDNRLAKNIGLTEEELFELAENNTPSLFPVMEKSIWDVLYDIDPEVTEATIPRDEMMMTVLSNDRGMQGSTVILYPGVLKKIADRHGSDLILLPSSVHEWIYLIDNGEMDIETIRGMVYEINRDQVEEDERLSDNVYRYCRETDTFEVILDQVLAE